MTWTQDEFRKIVNDIFDPSINGYINKPNTTGQDMSTTANKQPDNERPYAVREFEVIATYRTVIIVEGHGTEREMIDTIEDGLFVGGLEIGKNYNLNYDADIEDYTIECLDEQEEWE
tara:strand:- start:1249 stop:1599 length:351 start_codon:yes stop_codon:yes gene_type:complete